MVIVVCTLCLFATVGQEPAQGSPKKNGKLSLVERQQQKAALPACGIVIYKRHLQADEHAPFIEYSTIKIVAKVAIDMVRHDGKGIASIPRNQLVHHLVYPQETEEFVTFNQFNRQNKRLARLRSVAMRYRKAAPSLAPWIARLQHEVRMWEDGFCRINGQWINRVGFRYEQKVAELRQAFEERRTEILGTTYSKQNAEVARDDSPLPPMWALDLEQQIREQEATQRAARKKEAEHAKRQRSQRFLDQIEEERPFRTDWRLEK
ncbi:MAG: hypothetical protein ACI9R3_005333 [Verrucomicrobiales bacterium]